jgi:hypothetical protein
MSFSDQLEKWLEEKCERWEDAGPRTETYRARPGLLVYRLRSRKVGFWGLKRGVIEKLNASSEGWKVVLVDVNGNIAFVIDRSITNLMIQDGLLTLSRLDYYLLHERTELKDFERFTRFEDLKARLLEEASPMSAVVEAKNEDEVSEKIRQLSSLDREKFIVQLDGMLARPERASALVMRLKRNQALPALLKAKYGFMCQFCGFTIRKKDGHFYVEVAHITSLGAGGLDVSSNMLVLCPNHHKMLDMADAQVVSRSDRAVVFLINGQEYAANLRN